MIFKKIRRLSDNLGRALIAALAARVGRWKGALEALARGFEESAWQAMKGVLSALDDEGLESGVKEVGKAVKSVVNYVVEEGVLEDRGGTG